MRSEAWFYLCLAFFVLNGIGFYLGVEVLLKHLCDYRRAMTEAFSRDMQFAKHQLRLARRIEALEARIGTETDMEQLRAHVAELRRRCEDDGK
jgi:hypothetical protein